MDLTDSYLRAIPDDLRERYEFRETRKAARILKATNAEEFDELLEVLSDFELKRSDIIDPGGNKGAVATRLDKEFRDRGWREGRHDMSIRSVLKLMPYPAAGETEPHVVADREILSEGYKVDNVKGRVAIDVEWNAKDGNLDRDVGAYRALYDGGIIDGAVIITRTQADLRALSLTLTDRDPFKTTTTTNLLKLEPRMTRGDLGGCPLLAVAITARCLIS